MNTRSRRLPILAGVLALSLIAASCGDDDDESTADTSAETTAAAPRHCGGRRDNRGVR